MEDLAVGRLLRQLRLRLGWRQLDVAVKAGIARSVYSDIERGHLAEMKLSTLRKVANVLEVRLTIEAGWRGGRVERLLSGQHASMAERVIRLIVGAGWQAIPEVSFNHFGERGVVDIVCWHPATRTFLLVEIKTELADVHGLLAATHRRRRLALVIAREQGWEPAHVAQWVVMAESRTNRRRVAEHRSLLRAAFPVDGRSVLPWLRSPTGKVDALWFLPYVAHSGTRQARGGSYRVARRPLGTTAA